MLIIKKRNIQKGFSLIELMIAAAILAIALLGIFQAYSVGFMGMADARDRTEAVNYIQKTLEEYKNTSFNKIIDKPMRQIAGTKYSNGSIVIDMSKPGEETRLKKIITQVRWTARNGDIKLEEASTLIYSVEKTGELLSASEIVLYASPYFRILPNTSTDLYAEIHDANGNIVTDESYTINFVIISGNDLGYLDSVSDSTTNGIASVKFYSNLDADGSVSIQASADLDDNGSDDVFDTITIAISTGAEGIILVPVSEFAPVEGSVEINLYIVDASFDYELDEGAHIIPYDGEITLSASELGILSTTTINATDGTANFNVSSNGTPGTVEIIASTPDLDLGYTEVTFTGGAQSIQLTLEDDSIYEGESIEITITILDENKNSIPFSGSITITSDSGGSFDPESPIVFDNKRLRTVNFSSSNVGPVIITASGDDFENDVSINLEVLESLTPSYIELTAIPSTGVSADGLDCSVITATVYDDSVPSEIVTNYNGTINFYTTLDGSYFDNDFVELSSDDGGRYYVYLYSTVSGDAIITAEGSDGPTTIYNQEPNPVVEFYSDASGLRISSSKSPVVANGVDYTLITVEIIDDSHNVVSDYIGNILLSTNKGYFEGGHISTTLNFNDEGSKSIKLYSSSGVSEDATITAEANDIDAGFTATAYTTVTFIQPQEKNITYVENSVESYEHYTIIKFDIKVTGANINLTSTEISWTGDTNLDRIEIMSPKSDGTYDPVINTNGVSSPRTENISTTLYSEDPGLSTIRLTFTDNNRMKNQNINITFYEDETHYYQIQVYVPQ